MKCYLFGSYRPDGLKMAAVHCLLFHGRLLRGPKRKENGETPFLFNRNLVDAEIVLNGFETSKILSPIASPLVVSNRLARLITSTLPNVGFLPSHISKVVNVPYKLGDMGLASKLRTIEIENRWWNRLPHDEKLASTIDGYGELRMPRYQDLNHVGGKRFEVYMNYPGDDMFGPLQVELSEELFTQYPIIWHICGILFSEQAIELLSPYLNPDFFWWEKIEI